MRNGIIRYGAGCLEMKDGRYEYCSGDTSAYMDFDRSGARDIINFFSSTKKVEDEEIKYFNFTSNTVKDIRGAHYNYSNINIAMRELREKYHISSNNIFRSDIKNLIRMLGTGANDEGVREIINMVSKIKQIVRGNANGK